MAFGHHSFKRFVRLRPGPQFIPKPSRCICGHPVPSPSPGTPRAYLALGALRLGFTLITISTVFVHQHHVIDVIGGFALNMIGLLLINRPRVIGNDMLDQAKAD